MTASPWFCNTDTLLYPKRLKHVYISVSQKALAVKQSCCIKEIPTSLGNAVLKLAFLHLWNQHDKHTLWHLRKPYYNIRKWLLFYFLALLGHNLHTTVTYFTCTVWWILLIVYSCRTSTKIRQRTFPSL